MSALRNAGAPRLIEFTGERCIPWMPEPRIVYEHMHRYLWAAGIVRGRRVLELGSGEGFGAAILARTAAEVVGIDIDERTVDHSQVNYARPGVSFRLGDARNLEMFEADTFGAVVAFEVIEHFAEQEQALAEISRVLTPEGVVVMSTPDRRVYSEASGYDNPFHVRELSLDEFSALIGSRFRHQRIWGQRLIAGSHIAEVNRASDADEPIATGPSDFFVERAGEEWREASMAAPTYLLVLASESLLPAVPSPSTLADPKLEFVTSMEEELAAARENVSERDALIRQLQAEVDALRAQLAEERASAQESLQRVEESLSLLQQSVSFQLIQHLSVRVYDVIGKDSLPARLLQATLRLVGRLFLGKG